MPRLGSGIVTIGRGILASLSQVIELFSGASRCNISSTNQNMKAFNFLKYYGGKESPVSAVLILVLCIDKTARMTESCDCLSLISGDRQEK